MLNRHSWLYAGGAAAALIIGILFFAFEQGFIVMDLRFSRPSVTESSHASELRSGKKNVTLHYYKDQRMLQEPMTVVWSKSDVAGNIMALTNGWLTFMEAERLIDEKTVAESVALSENNKHAIISFNRVWLKSNAATRDKLKTVNSLLATVRDLVSDVKTISFLVKDEPMKDQHVEFEYPWPISGYGAA